MVQVSRSLQRRTAREKNDGVIRRGAHAKGHGLLNASFVVVPSARVCSASASS